MFVFFVGSFEHLICYLLFDSDLPSNISDFLEIITGCFDLPCIISDFMEIITGLFLLKVKGIKREISH